MLVALVCKEYGWTYEQYYDQPAEFIRVIHAMREVEGLVQKRETEMMKNSFRQTRVGRR